MPPPPKRRCLLLADGTTLACFQRGEHDAPTLVLEPNGRAYSFIAPNGSLSRHLTATSGSTHRAMVREALRARNQFAFSTADGSGEAVEPYVHGALLDKRVLKESVSIKRPRQTLQTRWPSGCLHVPTLYDERFGAFFMHSLDGRASMRLRGHGRLVDIEYTIQVNMSKETTSATQPEPSTFTTTTLRQTFGSAFPPPAFAFPTRLLLMVKDAWQAGIQDVSVLPQSHESAVSQLPANGAFTARPEFTALSEQPGGLTMTDVLRVASRPSRALYARVAVEVQEEMTYLLYRRREPSDPLLTILCELHDQSGLLECQASETSSICRWYDARGQLQQQFPLNVLPPSSFFTPESSSAPSIASVCSHLEYIISSFLATAAVTSSVEPHESESASCELVEQAENETGRFRAFADGHVRVAFADRTILQIAGDRTLCSFFFADGSSADMTVDSAPEMPHQSYIRRALEFADWAFATPEQRFARHLQRQQSELMVQQELHRIKVRCGLNSQQQQQLDPTTNLPDLDAMRSWGATAMMTSPPLASGGRLSLASVQQLQDETRQHMAHVDSLLRQAASDTQ